MFILGVYIAEALGNTTNAIVSQNIFFVYSSMCLYTTQIFVFILLLGGFSGALQVNEMVY